VPPGKIATENQMFSDLAKIEAGMLKSFRALSPRLLLEEVRSMLEALPNVGTKMSSSV
jgi:hypothetical protein